MSKSVSAFLLLLILLLLFSTTAAAASVYKVDIDINFVENWFFSKYDVDIYLNDLLVDTLSHGEDYSDVLYVEEGKNNIFLEKHGDSSIKGIIKLDVKGNTTVKCTILCFNDEISVTDIKIDTEKKNADEIAPESTVKPTIALTPVITEAPTPTPTSAVTEIPVGEAIPVINDEFDVSESESNRNISGTQPDNGEMSLEIPQEAQVAAKFEDLDLAAMTDEELNEALEAIKAEQRSRIKTKVVLNRTELVLNVGKTDKITATVEDLPEGEKAPKLEWSTSDKSVVTCNNGTVKALRAGEATISCNVRLSDGSLIYGECIIQVNTPISSLSVGKTSVNLNVGDSYLVPITIKPENASVKTVEYESTKPEVASVNSKGEIEGISAGNASISITTTDGSQKKATIFVKVTEKEYFPKGKTKTLTGTKTGIVCDVINQQFSKNLKDIFKNQMLSTLTATMTAYQLASLDKDINIDINYTKDSIMYIGLSKKDNALLYMAFQDTDGKFFLAAVTAKKNTIMYTKAKISRSEVKEFMKSSCVQYAGVSAEEVLYADEVLANME